MSNIKKYYWIKLKTDFFDLPTIDWLMEQENGCEYVLLYQKLCLMAANNGGTLIRQVGDLQIPYDAKKIAVITNFRLDIVIAAMDLYKKIGLVCEQDGGVLFLPYVLEIVGSESESAARVRKHRDIKEKNRKTEESDLP